MFKHSTSIRLRDTDATGVIYFTEQLRIAQEVFEEFLKSQGYVLSEIIQRHSFLIPIVHVASDYFFPLRFGDEIWIEMFIIEMGNSSFKLGFYVFEKKEQKKVGQVQIVQVAVSKDKGEKISLPGFLRKLLSRLQPV